MPGGADGGAELLVRPLGRARLGLEAEDLGVEAVAGGEVADEQAYLGEFHEWPSGGQDQRPVRPRSRAAAAVPAVEVRNTVGPSR